MQMQMQMNIQELPADVHGKIIEFLMDDYRTLHKQRMAPTFYVLERFAYPCRICNRLQMTNELCRVCIHRVVEELASVVPVWTHGRLLYIPFPTGMQRDLEEFLRFWLALRHLDFRAQRASIPFLPATMQPIHGDVLIVSPLRCNTLQHLFLRMPSHAPAWSWTADMHPVLGPPRPFPPPYRTGQTKQPKAVIAAAATFRCLNHLFPR